MNVTTKDILIMDKNIRSHYVRMNVMATDDWKLDGGALYKIYTTRAIRLAMETKIWIAMTAIRLSKKDREASVHNANRLLAVIDKMEGKTND